MSIERRLSQVRARLSVAEESAGRVAGSVLLVAVSKFHSASAIREAYAAGQRHFGENYPQELARKAEELSDLPDITWHMIGNIQSNKAKLVAQHAHWIHTVDGPVIARELGKRAAQLGKTLPVLVEVNVGGEQQKHGCLPDALDTALAAIGAEPALQARGLMTVPPHTDDPAGAVPFFAALRRLRDGHGGAGTLPELSMGMSHDLEGAVAEGATLVRVGTAIFGERPAR